MILLLLLSSVELRGSRSERRTKLVWSRTSEWTPSRTPNEYIYKYISYYIYEKKNDDDNGQTRLSFLRPRSNGCHCFVVFLLLVGIFVSDGVSIFFFHFFGSCCFIKSHLILYTHTVESQLVCVSGWHGERSKRKREGDR